MISFHMSRLDSYKNGHAQYYVEGECLSTDTKPINVANGSSLIEMDTGKVYFFDAENGEWREFA